MSSFAAGMLIGFSIGFLSVFALAGVLVCYIAYKVAKQRALDGAEGGGDGDEPPSGFRLAFDPDGNPIAIVDEASTEDNKSARGTQIDNRIAQVREMLETIKQRVAARDAESGVITETVACRSMNEGTQWMAHGKDIAH